MACCGRHRHAQGAWPCWCRRSCNAIRLAARFSCSASGADICSKRYGGTAQGLCPRARVHGSSSDGLCCSAREHSRISVPFLCRVCFRSAPQMRNYLRNQKVRIGMQTLAQRTFSFRPLPHCSTLCQRRHPLSGPRQLSMLARTNVRIRRKETWRGWLGGGF